MTNSNDSKVQVYVGNPNKGGYCSVQVISADGVVSDHRVHLRNVAQFARRYKPCVCHIRGRAYPVNPANPSLQATAGTGRSLHKARGIRRA